MKSLEFVHISVFLLYSLKRWIDFVNIFNVNFCTFQFFDVEKEKKILQFTLIERLILIIFFSVIIDSIFVSVCLQNGRSVQMMVG
jgi:hypothetical protein